MSIELQANALVECFTKELPKMQFIPASDREGVKEHLVVMASPNKTRYEKVDSAVWLWKYFVDKSLRSVTTNLRGYDDLSNYFDQYVQYEYLLFALDNNYRDHVLHPVWVMLLGFFLRRNFPTFNSIRNTAMMEITDLAQDTTFAKETQNIFKGLEEPLWCLIALTHDLGYPIQKTRSANRVMSRMIDNFGFLKNADFEYGLNIIHQTALDRLLDILSSRIIFPKIGYIIARHQGGRFDFAKSIEKLDHGVISAYLLETHLDCICELPEFSGVSDLFLGNTKQAAQWMFFIILFNTIAAHTNKNIYWRVFNTMPTLLFICDELDEFSRYSRSSKTKEWNEVRCRTEVECQDDSFQMTFIFYESDIAADIQSFFKGKVDKIWKRFETDDNKITEIAITCRDVRIVPNVEYFYHKTKAKETITRTPGCSSEDVRVFLAGQKDLSQTPKVT